LALAVPFRSRSRVLAFWACFAAFCALSTPARAGEIQLDVGAGVRKSTWRGDWSGGAQLGGGYRFANVFAVDFAVWEEGASVDHRVNTGLTLGVTGSLPLPTLRPTLRVYVIHQHEEGFVSVKDHPFGTIAGIGAGIRHRAGAGARFGLEIPFEKRKHVEWVALAGFDATWFPDSTLGPSAYFGVMGGIGLNYGLEELP
jgi:hypothetical protein